MFRVVLIILLFGALQGTEHNDTDTKESLEKIKSDMEKLSNLISSSLEESHYKLPLEEHAGCSWNKVNDSVESNGFLIPGAKTIEECQDACERTKDCSFFDWVPCQQLCYLPIRPTAQRYQLTCPDLTGAEPPPPPPVKISGPSTAHTPISSETAKQTAGETASPLQSSTPFKSVKPSSTAEPTTHLTSPTPIETVKLSTVKATNPISSTTPFETTKPPTPETTTTHLPSSPSTKTDKPTTPETTTQPSSPTPLETDELTTPEPTTPLQSSTLSETESPTTPEETRPLTSSTMIETDKLTTPESTSPLQSSTLSETESPTTTEATTLLTTSNPSETPYKSTTLETTTTTTTTQLPSPTPFETDSPTTPPTPFETDTPTTTETTALPTTTSTVSPTRPTVPVCKRRLDLAFVVDGSGSICNVVSRRNYNASCANWDFNLQFINKMIESLVIGSDDTRVALVTFSTWVKVEWTLNKYTDMTSLQSAVEKLAYPTGMTATADALQTLVTKIFTRAAGDRPYVPNRAILITDGEPNTETIPLASAIKAVHRSGVKVFVVGVTKYVNEKILRDISSPPQKINETYFLAEDYSSIDLVGEELLKETCIR